MLSRVVRRRFRIRRRDEGGAIAIIMAMMCVLLFTIAALSVDLGNAFTRRTDTQTQADYGALAAARTQNETAKAGMTIPTAMVDAVRDAMNANQPQDDNSICWTTKSCITSAHLTDGNLVNGETFGSAAGPPAARGMPRPSRACRSSPPGTRSSTGSPGCSASRTGTCRRPRWSTCSRRASA